MVDVWIFEWVSWCQVDRIMASACPLHIVKYHATLIYAANMHR